MQAQHSSDTGSKSSVKVMTHTHERRCRDFSYEKDGTEPYGTLETSVTDDTPHTATLGIDTVQARPNTADRLTYFLNVCSHFTRDERRKVTRSGIQPSNLDWSRLGEPHQYYQPDITAMGEALSNHIDAHPYEDLPANLIGNVLHILSGYSKVSEQRDQLNRDLAAEIAKHQETKTVLRRTMEQSEDSEGSGLRTELALDKQDTRWDSQDSYDRSGLFPKSQSLNSLDLDRGSRPSILLRGAFVKPNKAATTTASLQPDVSLSNTRSTCPFNYSISVQDGSICEEPARPVVEDCAAVGQELRQPVHISHRRGFSFQPGDDDVLHDRSYMKTDTLGMGQHEMEGPVTKTLTTNDITHADSDSASLSGRGQLHRHASTDSASTAFKLPSSDHSASSGWKLGLKYDLRMPRRRENRHPRTSCPSPSTNEMAIAAARAARKSISSIRTTERV